MPSRKRAVSRLRRQAVAATAERGSIWHTWFEKLWQPSAASARKRVVHVLAGIRADTGSAERILRRCTVHCLPLSRRARDSLAAFGFDGLAASWTARFLCAADAFNQVQVRVRTCRRSVSDRRSVFRRTDPAGHNGISPGSPPRRPLDRNRRPGHPCIVQRPDTRWLRCRRKRIG